VHKDLDIEQDEYSFDIGFQEDAVSLLINSPAQMITEKLKSLLRFGTRSTRYRDVFDICYLSERADKEMLLYCMEKYIFEDNTLSVNNMADVTLRLEQVFSSKSFVQNVSRSRRNWLDMPAEEALATDLEFFRSLSE
ncbi:MAG: nucleotidyl transferase AbiEii/AbiGii toxin family protein, partial [Clostridiales bacterium]|nr:nucleotidyl transferase AbiEii/AbiGii toxin family protein [Clostridiales bacterium]